MLQVIYTSPELKEQVRMKTLWVTWKERTAAVSTDFLFVQVVSGVFTWQGH